jgi:hypothetical protein
MLEAPSRSLGYLLTAGLEAVQAFCWILAFIHRYYPVCAGGRGGQPCRGACQLFRKSRGRRDQDCATYRLLLCTLRDLRGTSAAPPETGCPPLALFLPPLPP